MIKGVRLKKLLVHKDERGAVFEILRSDWKEFTGFGQTYITVCQPGWVKGWHYHKKQTDNFCVVRGKARIVLCSPDEKTFMEFVLSAGEPSLLTIPARVIHGFECVSKDETWILNVPNRLYNYKKPDEHRMKLNDPTIPYKKWARKKGW